MRYVIRLRGRHCGAKLHVVMYAVKATERLAVGEERAAICPLCGETTGVTCRRVEELPGSEETETTNT